MNAADTVVESWLEAHPYLRESAKFEALINDILADSGFSALDIPEWDKCSDGFKDGVPLLANRALSEAVMGQAEDLLALLVKRLSGADCPADVRRDCAVLDEEISRLPDTAIAIIKQVASGSEVALEIPKAFSAGLARFLGWRAMEYAVRPWRASLEEWLAEAGWNQPYCPLCGERPAMAQLVATQKGRERFLSCGCCRMRWSYLRLACAFCGNQDQGSLELLEIEQEDDFRIDVCAACNGYIKTYTEDGDEGLMLSDWSTLHLDVVAAERGLKRCANSLYEV